MSESGPPRTWTVASKDPPTERFEGEVWLVCPLKGFDCARVPRDRFGKEWATDVMAVHVAISHRTWN